MKLGQNSPSNSPTPPLLAFGAHPDDIEFGCGAIVAAETRAGRAAHLVVCSRGEAGSHGTPEQRTLESQNAAAILGASLEFLELDGDAHLHATPTHAITLAAVIRRFRPGIILAPSTVENQHPDHAQLGKLVRDAARLARYGGLKELKDAPPHTITHLLFYVLGAEAEPRNITPVFVDISDAETMKTWVAAMEAHASQTRARAYVDLQIARARANGLRAGVEHAISLFPSNPLLLGSLASLEGATRAF